ncbi:MAG: DUF4407 domain-containing protein [Bacteroidetes bacterium]|nr:DUF4407 domain-containing protein [Bacteroidota bacterium]
MKKFFWFCSGANIVLLQRAPTEHNKYQGIGATVFFTGLFAVISGGYALYYIFNDAISIWRISAGLIFGLIWGAMIFNLDRYIVSSMKKNSNFWNEIKLALPRIILATIIAFVISKPLELQIFHTSIEYELELMKQQELKAQEDALTNRFRLQIASLSNEISGLKNEIDSKANYRNQLDEVARREADGSGGTMKRGAATIYNLKKGDAIKAQAELENASNKNQPLILSKQKEKDILLTLVDSLKSTVKRGSFDGFDKRLAALGNISAKNNTIAMASLMVMLLFIAIELAPVLVKLLSGRGPYDELLEMEEHKFEMLCMEQMATLNQATYEKLQITIETGNQALQDELESNKELMKEIHVAKKELTKEMVNAWKQEELSNIRLKQPRRKVAEV